MTIDAFRKAVSKALQSKYATYLSEDELDEAMEDNEDIVQGAHTDSKDPNGYGTEWEIDNAAWNISQCI